MKRLHLRIFLFSVFLFSVFRLPSLAAPALLENGLTVSGGPLMDNGETNATRPWVEAQLLNATGAVAQATSGRFATITEPRLVLSLTATGTWYDAGSGVLTNAEGWSTTGTAITNGLQLYGINYLRSPLSTAGLARVSVGLANASPGNFTLFEALPSGEGSGPWSLTGSVTEARFALASEQQANITFNMMTAPMEAESSIVVTSALIWDWTTPAYVGTTNDHHGQHVLLSDAVAPDEALPLAQAQALAEAVRIQINSRDWSANPAITPVNLAGQPLRWDTAYSSYVETGNLYFAWHGNPIVRMNAGAYSGAFTNPAILGASLSGSNITLIVQGATGWRPYPEWSVDMESWTRLATNQFTSSYPVQSNSTYSLTFAAPNPTAYYRAWSTNESGGSITGTFEVLSGQFLHRGVRVATMNDLATIPMQDSTARLWAVAASNLAAAAYPASNPSNYIGTTALSPYIRTAAADSNYVAKSSFSPSSYLTVLSAQTNYWRITTAPASTTSFGAWGQMAVSGTNLYVYSPSLGQWLTVSGGSGTVDTDARARLDELSPAVSNAYSMALAAYSAANIGCTPFRLSAGITGTVNVCSGDVVAWVENPTTGVGRYSITNVQETSVYPAGLPISTNLYSCVFLITDLNYSEFGFRYAVSPRVAITDYAYTPFEAKSSALTNGTATNLVRILGWVQHTFEGELQPLTFSNQVWTSGDITYDAL